MYDKIGYKISIYCAFILQTLSVFLTFIAKDYNSLYTAALCAGLGHGIVEAVKELNFHLPIVVRFQGTNSKEGRNIINQSSLGLVSIDNFTEAAKKVVELAK